MALVLDEPSAAALPARRGRLRAPLAILLLVGLLLGWLAAGTQPSLEQAGWSGPLDARQLDDGIRATRYVLSVDDGEQVVLGSVRNGGRLPLTVLGVDEAHGLPWVTATFRARGQVPGEFGYLTAAAAKDAVTASSVTLAPGASADVLVRYDPPADLSMADGSYTELHDLLLSVRHLGVGSTQRVPLLQEPVVLVGGDTVARLEREGRFQD